MTITLENGNVELNIAKKDNGDDNAPHWFEFTVTLSMCPTVGGILTLRKEFDVSPDELKALIEAFNACPITPA